ASVRSEPGSNSPSELCINLFITYRPYSVVKHHGNLAAPENLKPLCRGGLTYPIPFRKSRSFFQLSFSFRPAFRASRSFKRLVNLSNLLTVVNLFFLKSNIFLSSPFQNLSAFIGLVNLSNPFTVVNIFFQLFSQAFFKLFKTGYFAFGTKSEKSVF
ncbi:hypothetical protein, partial [Seleniivibrio woodruffii]|uniref:hypothetical protein n=1 Tax=Seleniivibrio woodruffii TaxID=1078050 RepID=UPI001A9FD484